MYCRHYIETHKTELRRVYFYILRLHSPTLSSGFSFYSIIFSLFVRFVIFWALHVLLLSYYLCMPPLFFVVLSSVFCQSFHFFFPPFFCFTLLSIFSFSLSFIYP
eukprot:TRINITY_DN19377_c0_g1_i1.p2 TRINITY_DN19377_c0_g1~~TRINITY_DN19377_c0_g1_i1.p2  ORF type:complete len:105 (-),score=4.04 TRINITY_DN19377_c0_g1_i1:122-436(-)